MGANYCSNCGTALDTGVRYCPQCGHSVAETSDPEGGVSVQREHGRTVEAGGLNEMFVITSILIVAFFGLLVVGFSVGSDVIAGLSLVAWFISLITMFVDLHDLEGPLWDTRPILWVIAAALMYIVIAPLYIYKRSQVA